MFLCNTLNRTAQIIGLEFLRLKFVKKAEKFPVGGFNNRSTVLPDGIFRVVSSSNRVRLVLMNIMDPQTDIERFSKNVESHSLCDDLFQVGQCLNTRSVIPRGIPSNEIEKARKPAIEANRPDQDGWVEYRRSNVIKSPRSRSR